MATRVGGEDSHMFGQPQPSRIRQYAQEVAQRYVSQERVSELETEVEDSERRTLRLQKELMEETALRARSERQRDEAKREVENLTVRLEEAEKTINESKRPVKRANKSRQRSGTGGTVSDGAQRVDGGTAPKRKRNPKPANGSSKAGKAGPPTVQRSARKRGTAK